MKTIFVIADDDEAVSICQAAEPMEDWEGVELNGMDAGKMTMLHSLLTGDTFQDASSHYQAIYSGSEYGPWVFSIPRIVVERLATIEDEMEEVAEELAATEEFETGDWTLEQVEIVVSDLAASARICLEDEKKLFMWMGEM